MRGKITVIGSASDVDYSDNGQVQVVHLTSPSDRDLSGSDVVLLTGGDIAAAASATARRAPGAVLLVASQDGERDLCAALEASLLPRTRVVGVAPADAPAAVRAALRGEDTALDCWALCRGELGIENAVARVPAVLGAGGLRSISPARPRP